MIAEMELRAEDGSQLFLFALVPGADYFSADAYISQRAYPAGAKFTVVRGAKVVHIETQEAIREGAHFYPGDPQHFGRLAEPLLLKQVGVTDGSSQEATR
jgi:hypothetical protein